MVLPWHLPVSVCSTTNFQAASMDKFGGDDIDQVITGGIVFKGGSSKKKGPQEEKVKTKAKKKAYITGAHGSGSAKMKAEIRRRRANRHKGNH